MVTFANKLIKFGFFLFFTVAITSNLAAQPLSPNIHRVLFLGNSITYAGTYIAYIEAYYKLHYPNQQIEFVNVGLPSETVSGLSEEGHADNKFPRPDLHERLSRILALTKPDLVFACYGMNDGIYLSFDKKRFRKFKSGIIWLHKEVEKTGARIIHLTPPVYDGQKLNNMEYVNVLDRYSDWIICQKKTRKWEIIDIYSPMKNFLDANRKNDPKFALASDGVHPGDLGHWLMAKQVLLYLGINDVEKKLDIQSALLAFPKGMEVYKLVKQRQDITKDAWLTAIGHKRPGMKTSLPLQEALEKAAVIEKQMQTLLKQ